MGMDVYGLNPTTKAPPRPEHDDFDSEDWKAYFDGQNEAGQYFRNNVWFWRPLWDYVSTACSDYITEEDLENGHSNSGHIIGAEQCKGHAMLVMVREKSRTLTQATPSQSRTSKSFKYSLGTAVALRYVRACNIRSFFGRFVWNLSDHWRLNRLSVLCVSS